MGDKEGSVVFFCYAAASLLLVYFGVKFFLKRHVKTERVPFGLPALVCFLVTLENSCTAIVLLSGDAALLKILQRVRYLTHAVIVPLIMICLFELAYLVHKRRSVNFMGIKFDAGHRMAENKCSVLVRYSMWFFSLIVAGFSVAAAIEVTIDLDKASKTLRYTTERLKFSSFEGSLQDIADLLPPLLLIVFAIYIGGISWRYGTHYSFRIHSTYFNPWVVLVLGALAVLVGRLLHDEISLYTSNAGELVLLISLIMLLPEVHNDLKEITKFSDFLQGGVKRRTEVVVLDSSANVAAV